jgi:hypothetical protein
MDTGTVVILLVLVVAVLAGVALALKSGGSFRFGLSRDRVDVETRGPQHQARPRVDLGNEANLSNAAVDRIVGDETSEPGDVTMLNKADARGLRAKEIVGRTDPSLGESASRR